jgi:Domain of unknown function (DUF222)
MEELECLVDAVDQILMVAAADKSDQEVVRSLQVITRQVNRLQAAICEHTVAMKGTRAYEVAGCASPVEFLKKECHYSGSQARTVERCSTFLGTTLLRTAAALRAGDVAWPHVTTMVRGVDTLGVKEISEREAMWIDKIATQWGPERLQRVVRARVHETTSNPPTLRRRHDRRAKRVTLRLVEGVGYEMNGFVTLDDGATINRAVSTLTEKPTLERTHDPIVAIISQWLHNHEHRVQDQLRPQVTAAAAQNTAGGPWLEFDIAESSSGRLDTRIEHQSRPYWEFATMLHHRATRMPTRVRNGERCIRPGCRCQPKWCDLHSIIEWIDTGRPRAA